MIKNITSKFNAFKNPKKIIDDKIREKAIEKAKEKLMLNGLTVEEAGDKFEIIVKEEEDKIKSDLKDKSLIGMIAALGLEMVFNI